jgi:hypothetical protein
MVIMTFEFWLAFCCSSVEFGLYRGWIEDFGLVA